MYSLSYCIDRLQRAFVIAPASASYRLAILHRRVKAQARFGTEDEDGTSIMFDVDSEDQADRFPYGC